MPLSVSRPAETQSSSRNQSSSGYALRTCGRTQTPARGMRICLIMLKPRGRVLFRTRSRLRCLKLTSISQLSGCPTAIRICRVSLQLKAGTDAFIDAASHEATGQSVIRNSLWSCAINANSKCSKRQRLLAKKGKGVRIILRTSHPSPRLRRGG
jgi:hypothetical protein